jgi:drug/metabolite transporter (DMT)-like permease
LLVGAAGTAFAPILVRVSELPPTATAFWRMALAIPFIGLWMWLVRGKGAPSIPRSGRGDRTMLALAGVFFAGDLLALHASISLTSIANAVLFLNSQPIFVVLGAWLFFRQKVSGTFVGGLALALAGSFLVIGASFTLNRDRMIGDALGVLSGAFYAAYILVAVRLRAHHGSLPVMAWTSVVASPILLVAAWFTGVAAWPESLRGFGLVLALALIGQVVGNGLIVYALAHLPAAFSAVALLSQPLLAALFAWLLLGEPLGALQSAGIVIVLAGIWLCYLASRAVAMPRP